MKRKGLLITGMIAVVVSMLLVVGASAQFGQGPGGRRGGGPGFGPGFEPGPGGRGFPMFRQLDLTDEQKNQVRALQEKSFAATEQYREQLRQLQEQKRALIHSDNFNVETAKELANKEAALMAEMDLNRMVTQNAVYNVLTPEQKAKQAEFIKNRPAGRGPRK